MPCNLCWNFLILENRKCKKKEEQKEKKTHLMKELSLSSTYIFWIGLLDLLGIIFQNSSSYSLQVLNLNFNFLLQSSHTQDVREHSNTVSQRKVKLRNRNLGLWPGPVPGSRDCTGRMPCSGADEKALKQTFVPGLVSRMCCSLWDQMPFMVMGKIFTAAHLV